MRKIFKLGALFPFDVKLRLLAYSRSFLANQKARNAIVGAENLLKDNIRIMFSFGRKNNILIKKSVMKCLLSIGMLSFALSVPLLEKPPFNKLNTFKYTDKGTFILLWALTILYDGPFHDQIFLLCITKQHNATW